MKRLLIPIVALMLLAAAAPAQARPLHRCQPLGDTTLSTSGVQCSYARDTIARVGDALGNSHRSGTHHIRVRGVVGWVVTETHTFDCSARYIRVNRGGGVEVTVRCHDFGGANRGVALIRYTAYFEA